MKVNRSPLPRDGGAVVGRWWGPHEARARAARTKNEARAARTRNEARAARTKRAARAVDQTRSTWAPSAASLPSKSS